MLNPNLINPQELANKVDTLPQFKKDFLSSEQFISKLAELQKKHKLLPEADQPELLEQLITLLVAGFFPPKELSENLEEFLYMDHDPAMALEQDILDLLKPVLPSQTLTPAFAPIFTGKSTNNESTANVRIETQSKDKDLESRSRIESGMTKKEPPSVAEAVEDKPFIIHERSEVKPIINAPSSGATRQTFIRPQFTPVKDTTPPPTARVQAGGSVFGQKDIAPKVINYSAPRSEEPPRFAPYKPQTLRPGFAQKTRNSGSPIESGMTEEEDVNTINLRDLPK